VLPRRLLVALALVSAAAGLTGVHAARAGGPVPWCGSGEPATDLPDSISAFSWHVIYAVPSNGEDRFAAFAPRIAGDVAAMSDWWLGQDSTRRPRFDLLDSPSCGSEAGRVDVSFLRLPQPVGGDDSYANIVSEVAAAGFKSPDKGYLVYLDDTPHAGDQFGVCGVGGTDTTAQAYSLVYLQTCGQASDDDTRQVVATHELVHGLDAVLTQAPHYCNDGHVCDSSNDLMKAVIDDGDTLGSLSLDVGQDDYYGHSGTWWDTQDSVLLYHLDASPALPPAVVGLTATSTANRVVVDWTGTDLPSGGWYRVYAPDGSLLEEPSEAELTTSGLVGRVLQWTIRSANPLGLLGPPATLRFKVGYGIVDASGALLKDTVAPAAVTGLRATRTRKLVTLRWRKVSDVLGIRGYRVAAPGLAPRTVRATSVSLPLAKARGRTLTVQAVDEAGNRSSPAVVHVPR
jgi:hypothetical protein